MPHAAAHLVSFDRPLQVAFTAGRNILVSENQLISKITWRLMPFLGLLYLIAYIDRQNVSYAKLQMVDSLGMSDDA